MLAQVTEFSKIMILEALIPGDAGKGALLDANVLMASNFPMA